MTLLEIRASTLNPGTFKMRWNGFRPVRIGGLTSISEGIKMIIKHILGL